MIPLSVPYIAGNEWKYIKECLDTGWVSSAGAYVERFEKMMADYVGVKHAVACVNGTAALHISLLVAGIKPNDEVLITALTFIAPANAVRYVGAWPVFMDVKEDTWQMDPEKLIKFLTEECEEKNDCLFNRASRRPVTAIIPVHILGHSVDMDPILEIAKLFHLIVIEDATESLGVKYKGKKTGTLGDIACFSFNGNKIITTGGGGMIVTDNKECADKARYLTTQAKDDPIEYIHNEVGYNYRLTNIQAAMGVAQMEKLADFIDCKRAIAKRYQEGLSDVVGITLSKEASGTYATYWLYTILIDKDRYGLSSRELMAELEKEKIQSRPLWHPIHTLKPFNDCPSYQVKVVDKLYRDCLSIPCSVGLTPEDQAKVIQCIYNKADA
ncbi:MAG: LegC family aminotransferase [bacterium]|nr:LegC family aminotransferase [bacterium]